ncbi:hypothetical protein CERSUDRAFT_97861 [Gelatoporia subvermispora B]|uniref:Uncharacterized protein n=1 Tax=Ceriporiopsis subvermispora (strain B) TaxID=914234 RepID=M2R4X6_CERS8|nr:hypothetical protein CERSUDRAFT_97861 [Gelatoporia subvermispora B]
MTSSASVPPLDKISLIGGWIETVLWGINSVVFLGACWLVIELSRAGVAYAGTIILARPGVNIFGSTLRDLGLISWSLDITVNVTVTTAIAGRLWYMGKKLSIASSSGTHIQSTYGTAMITMIESGALYAAVTIVLLGLYVSKNPAALVAIDDATQLAVLVPMLIIVRVGLGLTHGLPRAYRSYVERQDDQPVTFSMGPIRFPHRRKQPNFGGQITVNREVVTTDLSKNLSGDLDMSDFKGPSEDPEGHSVKSSDPLTSHARAW